MSGVFISYRRNDSSWFARSLFDALRAAFPSHAIFIDVEGIDAGLDFVDVINERLSSCEVLLTIIGKRWLEESAPNGSRRIDDPNDNVRAEIEAALQRKIRVIPVLVDGAQIPAQSELPESLASLSRRNGLEITHARFSSDTTRLVDVLSSVLPSETRSASKSRAAKSQSAVRSHAAVKSHTPPKSRKAVERDARPWRWIAAGAAALIPVAALSAVFVLRAWAPPASSEGPREKTASLDAAPSGEPPMKMGRSFSTTAVPGATQPAPEASVPYIFPNTYGPDKVPVAPSEVASIEPETTQFAAAAAGSGPASFKGLSNIDVVDKVDLDTDKASARLRIGPDQFVARRADCGSLTVHAEFGSYSIVDKLVEKSSTKSGGCFVKTSWKDHQSETVADNLTAERPRVLNQTLHLLCPSTYGDMVKDCRAY